MSKRLSQSTSLEYFLLRLGNVAARPLTLFAVWAQYDGLTASVVALAFTFSSWLMAPMSLGSFRWILPIETKYDLAKSPNTHASGTYSVIVYFSLSFFVPAVYVIVWLMLGNVSAGILASLVVAYDFVALEQSRRILYNGLLVRWARFLLARNLVLITFWVGGLLIATWISPNSVGPDAIAIICLATVPLLIFVLWHFVWRQNLSRNFGSIIVYIPIAWCRVRNYWQYSVGGVLNKSHQHIDKIIIAFSIPEYIWVVAMVNYLASVPVLAYEMINLAKLKSTILKLNRKQIATRRQIRRADVYVFALFAIPSGVAIFAFLRTQGFVNEALFVLAIYLVFSWFYCLSIKRTELVVWSAKNKWAPFQIEFLAGTITIILSMSVAFAGAGIILVKLPALVGAFAKNWLANRELRKPEID